MIFKKILKSTDLTLDMSLEKRQYRPGERVRGTLSIKTEKASKATQLILFAEGKESTIITASESTGAGSSSSLDTTTRTYREINTFFSKDLSHLLQESVSCNILQDGTLEILPQNKVIPFDFTLPDDNNLFSSYKGKHANITYTVKRTADITKKLDVNKEEQFSVINYNNKMVTYSSNSSFGGENKNDTINATTIENQNNISPSTIIEGEEKDADKENYEARFEQIFGKQANRTSPQDRPRRYFTFSGMSMNFDLGTIFAKGREHFLKENSEAKIDLLDHKNNNAPYSPGHTVKGEVILLLPSNEEQEEMRQKIRGMKITLSGVENAFAQELQRVSTIEKCEKIIELNGNENGGNEDDNNDNTIPFEFEIPQDVN
jgi:Arrestin (or S-antigen), N-terminal domain